MERAAALYELIFAVIVVASLYGVHFVRCFVGLFLFFGTNLVWVLGLGIRNCRAGRRTINFFSSLIMEGVEQMKEQLSCSSRAECLCW